MNSNTELDIVTIDKKIATVIAYKRKYTTTHKYNVYYFGDFKLSFMKKSFLSFHIKDMIHIIYE